MRFPKIMSLSSVLFVTCFGPVLAFAKNIPPENRISIEKAREVALRAYSGKIQGEELEFEGGKWIYSFDLKNSKDRRVHEIHIDALNGKLLDAHTETPAEERKELKEDARSSESE